MDFVGHVELRLRIPIETVEEALPVISVLAPSPWRAQIQLAPIVGDGKVGSISVQVKVQDERIVWLHKTVPTLQEVTDGPVLILQAEHLAFRALREVLTSIAASTLQAELIRGLDDQAWYVVSSEWELADGQRVKPPQATIVGSWLLAYEVASRAPLTAAAWQEAQLHVSGALPPPLWRTILLDAYAAWWREDLPGTVLRAATALEVGASPHLPEKFDVPSLRARAGLATRNPTLDRNVSELWYSRHGIIHYGRSELYTAAPKISSPIRPLNADDVRRFLATVPEVMSLLETRPPP